MWKEDVGLHQKIWIFFWPSLSEPILQGDISLQYLEKWTEKKDTDKPSLSSVNITIGTSR